MKMVIRILVANTIGRIGTWWMSRADRNVCRFSNDTDDES